MTDRTLDVIDYDPTTGDPVAVLHGDGVFPVARDRCRDCGSLFDGSSIGHPAAENPTVCRSCGDLRISIACDAEQEL